MKKPSRWLHKIILAAYFLAIVWTSFTHAAEFSAQQRAVPATLTSTILTSPRIVIHPLFRGPWAVRAYVQSAAQASGVNPHIAEWIVSHESRHHPEATGDGGESRGLWQINKAWHPEVSDACAYDVTCSTGWSLQRIRAGYLDEWSTWKYCKAKFRDCPF